MWRHRSVDQYGNVGFIERAAREALAVPNVDLLAVPALAFDPRALGADERMIASDEGFSIERSLGKLPCCSGR